MNTKQVCVQDLIGPIPTTKKKDYYLVAMNVANSNNHLFFVGCSKNDAEIINKFLRKENIKDLSIRGDAYELLNLLQINKKISISSILLDNTHGEFTASVMFSDDDKKSTRAFLSNVGIGIIISMNLNIPLILTDESYALLPNEWNNYICFKSEIKKNGVRLFPLSKLDNTETLKIMCEFLEKIGKLHA